MSPYIQNAGSGSAYWEEVNQRQAEIKAELPKGAESVFITSLENRRKQMVGGRVFEATVRNAAMRLTEQTHRLSTPDEIQGHKDRNAAELVRLRELEEGRKNTLTIKPSTQDNERLAGVVAAAVATVMDSQKKK